MKKKVLAVGTTNRKGSINRKLVDFACTLLRESAADAVDMREYEMPLYGEDRERVEGIPEPASAFRDLIGKYDGLIISLAEHNGAYSAIFKNLIDWLSVQEGRVWQHKAVLLLSASTGARGARLVLGMAEHYFPRLGAQVTGTFSIGNFRENFNPEQGITDTGKLAELKEKIAVFESAMQLGA